MNTNTGETKMSVFKLPFGQKLIKEVADFLLVQQNHFYEYSGVVTDQVWFKYYIHKDVVNVKGNYGCVFFAEGGKYSAFSKDLKKNIFSSLNDAFEFVRREWA